LKAGLFLRVGFGDRGAIGPGKVALLEAVRDTASISAAARRLGMSYKQAWTLMEEVQACLGRAVVETRAGGRRGGGAEVTALGLQVIEAYRAMEAKAGTLLAADLRRFGRLAR
jgi:molybdate transport system regulatory protein